MRVAVTLLTLAVIIVFLVRCLEPRNDAAKELDDGRSTESSDTSSVNEINADDVRLIGGNPLIEKFGAEDGSTRSDLEALRDIVRDCQLYIKDFDRFHLPDNPGIVRFLQGGNPEKLAWIPRDFEFLNAEGELVDRQGVPVFFHRLSGTRFEYRAAGPDREHWTSDDVVVR